MHLLEKDLKSTQSILRDIFGRSEFRPNQYKVINAVLSHSDVLVVLPTGYGKSLTYQLPAVQESYASKKFTVVVSPLLALINDQVMYLHSLGIAAETCNSTMSSERRAKVLKMFSEGNGCLLYVSPEQCFSAPFQSFLRRSVDGVSRIVVDEAHCAVEWGSDFRPHYAKLGSELRPLLPGVPIVALTGTASPEMQTQIIQTLNLKNPKMIVSTTERPQLHYEVRYIESDYDKLQDLIKFISIYRMRIKKLKLFRKSSCGYPACGIIYCRTRRSTEYIADQLNSELGKCSVAFHAGLTNSTKVDIMQKWINGDPEYAVIVATVAFGLGIDKPDTRFVIHFDLPQNMESFIQQTGRGGRDRKACRCILYYGGADANRCLQHAKQFKDNTNSEKSTLALIKFAKQIDTCRHESVGKYFGESKHVCDYACDYCKNKDRLRVRYNEWQNW